MSCPLLPGLPDDLAIHCLVRASRSIHGVLRCVCRRWRDLLSSPFFFDLRQNQGLAQEWLYVMVRTNTGLYQWLRFQDEGRLWIPLPPLPHSAIGAAYAVTARRLFMFGGLRHEAATRNVWSYDPILNRWEPCAPMAMPREFAAAGVIGGQIYVVGGCSPGLCNASAWAEVYDPLRNRWRSIASPLETRYKWMHGNAVLKGKLFAVADSGGISFDPSSSTWDSISASLDRGWKGRAAVVNHVLFSSNYLGGILGYDLEEDDWLEVKGWDKEVPKMVSCAMLTNVAGKLYVLWELPRQGGQTKVALAALDIHKEARSLRARVLWYHVVSCSMLSGAIIQSVSLAL